MGNLHIGQAFLYNLRLIEYFLKIVSDNYYRPKEELRQKLIDGLKDGALNPRFRWKRFSSARLASLFGVSGTSINNYFNVFNEKENTAAIRIMKDMGIKHEELSEQDTDGTLHGVNKDENVNISPNLDLLVINEALRYLSDNRELLLRLLFCWHTLTEEQEDKLEKQDYAYINDLRELLSQFRGSIPTGIDFIEESSAIERYFKIYAHLLKQGNIFGYTLLECQAYRSPALTIKMLYELLEVYCWCYTVIPFDTKVKKAVTDASWLDEAKSVLLVQRYSGKSWSDAITEAFYPIINRQRQESAFMKAIKSLGADGNHFSDKYLNSVQDIISRSALISRTSDGRISDRSYQRATAFIPPDNGGKNSIPECNRAYLPILEGLYDYSRFDRFIPDRSFVSPVPDFGPFNELRAKYYKKAVRQVAGAGHGDIPSAEKACLIDVSYGDDGTITVKFGRKDFFTAIADRNLALDFISPTQENLDRAILYLLELGNNALETYLPGEDSARLQEIYNCIIFDKKEPAAVFTAIRDGNTAKVYENLKKRLRAEFDKLIGDIFFKKAIGKSYRDAMLGFCGVGLFILVTEESGYTYLLLSLRSGRVSEVPNKLSYAASGSIDFYLKPFETLKRELDPRFRQSFVDPFRNAAKEAYEEIALVDLEPKNLILNGVGLNLENFVVQFDFIYHAFTPNGGSGQIVDDSVNAEDFESELFRIPFSKRLVEALVSNYAVEITAACSLLRILDSHSEFLWKEK